MKKHALYLLAISLAVAANLLFLKNEMLGITQFLYYIPAVMGVCFYRGKGVFAAGLLAAFHVACVGIFNADVSVLLQSAVQAFAVMALSVLVYVLINRNREQKAELEKFFSAHAEAMCVLDDQGRFLRANKAFQDTLGYSEKDIKNRRFDDFAHPDDRKVLTEQKYFKDKAQLVTLAARSLCIDGSFKNLEWRAFYHNGKIYATARDITEHTQLIRKLKNSEVLMNVEEALANMGSWQLDFPSDEMTASPGLFRILDIPYEKGTINRQRIIDRIYPQDQPLVIKAVNEAAENKTDYSLEYRIVLPDGKLRWLSSKSTFFLEAGGSLKQMGFIMDITDQKLSQDALEQQQKLLETTLLSIGDGVIVTNEKGFVRMVNHEAEIISGYSSEETIGTYISQYYKIYSKVTGKQILLHRDDILANGGLIVLQDDVYAVCKDGAKRDIEIKLTSIVLDDGTLAGFNVIFRDVTEKRVSEQEILYLTYHDKLTGLYNRRYFEENIAKLDQKPNLPISVIMGDVNGLKLANDVFGHLQGDNLLITAGRVMQQVCGPAHIVARWGGDEFGILLPNTSLHEAEKIAEQIHEKCMQEFVGTINLSISLGFAAKTDPDENIMEVLKKADDSMYKNKLLESRSIKSRAVHSVLNTLHEKNSREEIHSVKVGELCRRFGKAIGLSKSQVNDLEILGKIHDIGKISVDESILMKEPALSREEVKAAERHAEKGYHIVLSSPDLSYLANDVLSHHERWDGKGYPNGLAGPGIPFLSRILSVVDAFDSMTSDKPYRKALSVEQALDELQKNAGTQFDSDLTIKFINFYKNSVQGNEESENHPEE